MHDIEPSPIADTQDTQSEVGAHRGRVLRVRNKSGKAVNVRVALANASLARTAEHHPNSREQVARDDREARGERCNASQPSRNTNEVDDESRLARLRNGEMEEVQPAATNTNETMIDTHVYDAHASGPLNRKIVEAIDDMSNRLDRVQNKSEVVATLSMRGSVSVLRRYSDETVHSGLRFSDELRLGKRSGHCTKGECATQTGGRRRRSRVPRSPSPRY